MEISPKEAKWLLEVIEHTPIEMNVGQLLKNAVQPSEMVLGIMKKLREVIVSNQMTIEDVPDVKKEAPQIED